MSEWSEYEVSVITDAYVEAAEFADWPRDDAGQEDDTCHGWSDEALIGLRADVAAFVRDEDAQIQGALAFWRETFGLGQIGHDLWLTRNHHGAGFWDRDYSEPGATFGRLLTNAAHALGECSVYVGDDGFAYVQ